MKYKKKKLTPKQYLINLNTQKDTLKTDLWMYQSGVYLSNLAIGDKEVFLATKLANEILKNYVDLLASDDAVLVHSFILKVRDPIKRTKITKNQSYQVMNISKKIKRLAAKLGN